MVDLKRQNVCGVQGGDASKDNISSLPDCLLHHILSFLPTKDVVSTGILSRRWKSLWTGVPNLDFDDLLLYSSRFSLWYPIEISCFMNFVERVLLLRDGSNITNFRLSCRVCFSASRVHSWISAAVSHKVQQLDVCLFVEGPFMLPLSVFDCQSLVILKLEMNCTLQLPSHISLPSLKTLHLSLVTLPNDNSIQKLFSGCSILEELAMVDCEWAHLNSMAINIPSLKRLIMEDLPVFSPVDNHGGCDVKIEAPALSFFSYRGYLTNNIHLSKLSPSMAWLHVPTLYQDGKEMARFVKLLQALENVISLRISNYTIELLFLADKVLDNLPVFQSLEHLELSTQLEDRVVKGLLEFLYCLPKLSKLDFSKGLDPHLSIREDEWMLESVPDCFLSSLKTLGLWDFHGNNGELFLVKSFLENAVSLQRINIFPCKHSISSFEEQQKWRNEVKSLFTRSEHCVINFR